MREQQASGKLRSLVWPLFFQHTAREGDRFAARLDMYNKRQIEFDRGEVVDFWSKTMGEHSGDRGLAEASLRGLGGKNLITALSSSFPNPAAETLANICQAVAASGAGQLLARAVSSTRPGSFTKMSSAVLGAKSPATMRGARSLKAHELPAPQRIAS